MLDFKRKKWESGLYFKKFCPHLPEHPKEFSNFGLSIRQSNIFYFALPIDACGMTTRGLGSHFEFEKNHPPTNGWLHGINRN